MSEAKNNSIPQVKQPLQVPTSVKNAGQDMIDELPEGWASAKLADVISSDGLFTDGDWVESKDQDPNGDVRLVQLADVGDGYYRNRSARFLTSVKAKELGCSFLQPGDVLIARMPEPLGRACVFPGDSKPSVTVVDVCIVRPGAKGVDARWLLYAINSLEFRACMEEFERGTTRKRISRTNLAGLPLAVSPLPEQRRIVAKVEQLLAQVNAARDRLAKVPSILKRFRQSVLAAACSGRLTEEWREKNCCAHGEWSVVRLADVADLRLGKMLDKEKNKGEPIKYLRNINVRWFSFDLSDLLQMRATKEERSELAIRDGDLLVCEGGEPGRCAVWDGGCTDLIFQKAIHRVRPDKRVSPHWLALSIRYAAESGCLEEYFTGSTIKHLTGKELAKYEFSVPSIDEQNEITHRVAVLFEQLQHIESCVSHALSITDKSSQSILSKAFRGELVPTEAELARAEGRGYETGEELLARIKATRSEPQKKSKPGRSSKRLKRTAAREEA